MRALQQVAFGDPADVVKLATLPDPTPGPDDLVIRMEAAGVHIADLKNFTGERRQGAKVLPRIPGYEGIGRVAACGENVTAFNIGDRVFPWWSAGTFAELVCLPADKVMPAPEGDAVQLSLMLVNGMTAVILLEDFATLKPGDWLLQNGANSNCGRYIITLAKERGVKTCNIVRRADVTDELKTAGADAVVIDSDDAPMLVERVSVATHNADIKLGLDMVAGAAAGRIAQCLASGGIVVNYGVMSGEPSQIPFHELFGKDSMFTGMSTGRGMAKRNMPELRRIYAKLAGMIAGGQLRAAIAGTYTLDHAAEAFRHAAQTGAARDGKIVLLPNG
jgi:mitochondrial enoyl-[acyl-carrier protein] reductase / trans-2-enoyl-CoA reductase